MHPRALVVVVAACIAAGILAVSGCPANRPEPPQGTAPVPAPPPASSPSTPSADKASVEHPVTLTVFAGAASKPALEQLSKVYQQKTGTKVDITFGGSGAVLTQFSQEQYGDVYIPGSDDFMDKAEGKGAVEKDTRTVLVYLVPMICVPKGNPKGIKGLDDLAQDGLRVVIGDTKAVCLGAIAHEMLQKKGLWDSVQKRIVSFASNCEDVLNSLLLGEADAVIGWDAWPRQHPDSVEGIAVAKDLARPRNIPASVIKWSKQPDAAKAFIEFLISKEARMAFEENGYTVTP